MIIKGQTFTRQQVDDITAPWLQLCKEQEARIEALRKALMHIQRMSTAPLITDIAETALLEASDE